MHVTSKFIYKLSALSKYQFRTSKAHLIDQLMVTWV